jgi:hypothetical protein
MDPDTTLKLIADHLESGDEEAAENSCRDLNEWMAQGGFNPIWANHPTATDFYAKLSKKGMQRVTEGIITPASRKHEEERLLRNERTTLIYDTIVRVYPCSHLFAAAAICDALFPCPVEEQLTSFS